MHPTHFIRTKHTSNEFNFCFFPSFDEIHQNQQFVISKLNIFPLFGFNPVLINITASGRAREDEILKSVNLEPEKPIQQQELIP